MRTGPKSGEWRYISHAIEFLLIGQESQQGFLLSADDEQLGGGGDICRKPLASTNNPTHIKIFLVAAIRQAELRVQAYTQPIMVVGSKYLDGAIEEKMAASSFWLL